MQPITARSRIGLAVVRLVVTCNLIWLRSCGSGINSGSGSSKQFRTVQGTQVVSHKWESGSTDVPDDLSQTTIAAYVPDGFGGYQISSGTGTSDGRYSVPGVPQGGFWLQIGTNFYWTTASTMDTGYSVAQGRVNTPPTLNTSLAVDLSRSLPIQNGDIFELYIPNLAYGQDDDYYRWDGPLIDSTQGDRVYVSHFTKSSSSGSYLLTVNAEMTGPLSIQMGGGQNNQMQGEMSPVGGSFMADFRTSAFASYLPQIAAHPGVSLFYAGAEAVPPSASRADFRDFSGILDRIHTSATLVNYLQYSSSFANDVNLGSINYANSYSSKYSTVYFADYRVVQPYSLPGANSPNILRADMVINSVVAPSTTQPIQVQLSPVTGLTLDLADVFGSNLTAVGLSPTIRWNPPTQGTATFYRIDLYQLGIGSYHGQSWVTFSLTGRFQTPATSLQVPAGILSPGSQYVLRVTACNVTAANIETSPLRTTYPFACTDVLSSMFTIDGS